MVEETKRFFNHLYKRPYAIEPGAFALDLYRLVCMVLADRRVAKNAVVTPESVRVLVDRQVAKNVVLTSESLGKLQATFLRSEITRILISSAIGLRIQFEQRPNGITKSAIERVNCGKLYPCWKTDRKRVEVLGLREACNKIIHANDVRFDVVRPNAAMKGTYLRPRLFLYGRKGCDDWRAVLSLVDFAKWATAAFLWS